MWTWTRQNWFLDVAVWLLISGGMGGVFFLLKGDSWRQGDKTLYWSLLLCLAMGVAWVLLRIFVRRMLHAIPWRNLVWIFILLVPMAVWFATSVIAFVCQLPISRSVFDLTVITAGLGWGTISQWLGCGLSFETQDA